MRDEIITIRHLDKATTINLQRLAKSLGMSFRTDISHQTLADMVYQKIREPKKEELDEYEAWWVSSFPSLAAMEQSHGNTVK
jgi:hypothetical protein